MGGATCRMRNGLVLIELMLVLVVTGILVTFAAPRLSYAIDDAAVRDETMRVVAAIDAARGAAMRLGAVAQLTLADSAYRITAVVNGDTVLAWRQHGSLQSGVRIAGAAQPMAFGPSGLASGVSNRTLTLTRQRAARKIVMSRLGRLTY